MLTASDPNGIVYIKTDQLDGETDLKPRVEVEMFSRMNLDQVRHFEVMFNTAKNKLSEFEGKVREIRELEVVNNDNSDDEPQIIEQGK